MKKIEIELDDKLYADVTELYTELGLDIKTAVNMFLHKSLQKEGIPFKVKLSKPKKQVKESVIESPIINDLNF